MAVCVGHGTLRAAVMGMADREPDPAELKAYDEEMRNYYQHRSSNAKDTAWSDELERILLRERRPFVLGFLQKKGFAEK